MHCLSRIAFFAALYTGTVVTAWAGSINVSTNASVTATYGTFSQNAGPFPWKDLGISANASVSAGVLNVGVGGSTSYNLNSTISGNEVFTPGSTVLRLGYTPGWTGSFSGAPAATGNLKSQFVYHIGPISGSKNLFNLPLASSGVNGDLSASLNSGIGTPVSATQTDNGPGVTAGFTLSAQAFCPFCVTVASVSLGVKVGTQIQQGVSATPTVTNGDLVWYSKTQAYSPTATFVAGSAGEVDNTFANPALSLGLVSGDTFYMNILPAIELTMPVLNGASVTVPAGITASWNIFGVGGSANYPLGDLYSLSNGGEKFDFNSTFYGDFFYSIPLQFTGGCLARCVFNYQAPPSGGSSTENGGIPMDIPPTVTITGGGATPGGYGISDHGMLFPEPVNGNVCGPAGTPNAGACINEATLSSTVSSSPEPGSFALLGLGLAGLGVVRRARLSRIGRALRK